MLEWNVDIGQHIAAVHERDRLVDMRVGVDILQPDPGAERAKLAHDVEKARGDLAVAPRALGVFEVAAIGARVLRDDDELLDARLGEPLGFAQDVARRTRCEAPAQARNDAERAAVVAAFGDLEIGVVARREPNALAGNEIDELVAGAGAAARTAAITLSNACGPVTPKTLGKASRIASGSAPMQPVTITRPFSFIASPIAASDSAFALSRKPQVLTMTASAPAWLRASS